MNAGLKAMFDAAKAAGACALVEEVGKFETVEQALSSDKGPMMAMWYATMVVKTRMPYFEATIRRDARAWSMYSTALGMK